MKKLLLSLITAMAFACLYVGNLEAQSVTRLCITTNGTNCVPITAAFPLPITGTISASAVTSAIASGTLPSLGAGATSTYQSLSGGQYIQPIFGTTIVSAVNGLPVNCVTGCAGGSQSNASSAIATSADNGKSVSWLYGFNGTTWDQLQVDGSKFLKTIAQSGSTTAVTGTVTITSSTMPISGTVAATQSGTWNIATLTSITNPVLISASTVTPTTVSGTVTITSSTMPISGTVAATQSGTWNVGTVTTLTSITNPVVVSANTVTPVSGTFWQTTQPVSIAATVAVSNAALALAQGSTTAGQTGPIIQGAVTTASPTYTTAQTSPLSLTTSGGLRVAIISGGGSGGTSSDFGAAFPTPGTAIGVISGSTMTYLKADGLNNLSVNCTVGCAGGSFNNNSDAVATSSTNGQTAAWLYGFNGSTYDRLQVDGSKNLKISLSASTATVTITTDTVKASQFGTWTVQPGNTANTTPWLATINQGGNSATVTGSNALKVDGSAVTQPISIASTITITSDTVTVRQLATPWAVNLASGTVASGAVASGAFASGSISSGAVASGAFASGAVASGAYSSGSLASGAVVDLTNLSTPITATTATATKGIMLGGQYNSTQPTASNGQQLGLQVSTRGELKNNICDAAGNARCANVDASNRLSVTIDASTVTAIATNLAQVGGTTVVNGGVAGILAVGGNVANAVTATANPVPVGGVFTTAPTTLTTGQTATLQFTAAQNLKHDLTTISGSTVSVNSGALGNGVQRVTLATDQVALTTAGVFSVKIDQTTPGTTNLVALAANQSVNLAQVGGTNTVSGGVAGSQSVGGTVATNVAITANPINLGAQAVSSENTAVTTARQVQLVADLVGKLIVLPYSNPENFVSGVITSAMTGTTSTSLVAAPSAGLRNYLTACTFSNSHATVGTDIIIQDGSSGTTIWNVPASAVYGGAHIVFPTPLRQPTTATAIFVANVTTGASTKAACSGYKGA